MVKSQEKNFESDHLEIYEYFSEIFRDFKWKVPQNELFLKGQLQVFISFNRTLKQSTSFEKLANFFN